MGKIINKVDEFFSTFIEDEAGRFFFLHLPFWGLTGIVTWQVLEHLGLYLIFAFVVFVALPFIAASGFMGIYDSEFRYLDQSERLKFFRVSGAIAVGATLLLIGIPGVYFGLLMNVVRSEIFSKAFWVVITYWWRFFNFYHEYKIKDMRDFLKGFTFNYQHCQIAFFISSAIVAPLMFYWLFVRAKKKERAQALETIRLEEEARLAQDRKEAREKIIAERERVNSERLRFEQEAKIAEQRKLQAKINEVRGKDPWESGFL